MAPQIIKNVFSSRGISYGYGNILSRRPELAALAMQVIESWSFSDMRLYGMLANFMKTDSHTAIKMLHSIESDGTKRTVVRTAAEAFLTPQDFRLFTAILKITKASRDRRHQFAHHVWAITDDLPDALLLFDPRDSNAHVAEALEQVARKDLLGEVPKPMSGKSAFDSMYVYRKADLEQDIAAAQKAQQLFTSFALLVHHIDQPLAETIRTQLSQEPQVAQELQRASTQTPT